MTTRKSITPKVVCFSALAFYSAFSCAQLSTNGIAASSASADDSGSWIVSSDVSHSTIARGIPVYALERSGWQDLRNRSGSQARADQRTEIRLTAQHPTGWRLASVLRSQASLEVTDEAIELTRALEVKNFPATNRTFQVKASSINWRGQGFEIGTPWITTFLGGPRLQADMQWLVLSQIRTIDLDGSASFSSATQAYDFDLRGQRSALSVNAPFLPPPRRRGSAVSVSIAFEGDFHPQGKYAFRAKDLMSRLSWRGMTSEDLTINTQVQTLRPDGFIDYQPAIIGNNKLVQLNRKIIPTWLASARWQHTSKDTLEVVFRSDSGIVSSWLNWHHQPSKYGWHWSVGFEPRKQAARLRVGYDALNVEIATDGKGLSSEIRQLNLSLQTTF